MNYFTGINNSISLEAHNQRKTNQNLKDKILKTSLDFFLKPIKSDRLVGKIFWLTFLILSLAGCVYFVVLAILDFLNYDTTTSIYQINEKESQFPTISFCSDNDKNIKETNFEINITKFWFNYKDLKNECQNHFEIYNDTSLGKCFRFNSGKNMSNQSIPIKYSKKSGYNDGLLLELYSNASINFSQILIHIHNHTQTPLTIHNKGIWINSASETYFLINRIYDEKLDQPYNDCFKNVSEFPFNKTIIDYMKSIKYDYSQKECIILCRNYKSIEESDCNCSIKSLDEKFRVKCIDSIDDFEIKNCSMSFLANFDVEKCNEYCPLECESFTHEIYARSQTIVGTGNISEYFESELFQTYSDVANHYYGIYVYYNDLKYTFIKQNPKIEIFGLISEIGGTFSLFIGLNTFSFLELFEILIELIFN